MFSTCLSIAIFRLFGYLSLNEKTFFTTLCAKLFFTTSFGKTNFLSYCFLISVRLLYSVFNEHKCNLSTAIGLDGLEAHSGVPRFYAFRESASDIFDLFRNLAIAIGLDGLEPSTSRLSGARSNHLSYRPLLSISVIIGSSSEWR